MGAGFVTSGSGLSPELGVRVWYSGIAGRGHRPEGRLISVRDLNAWCEPTGPDPQRRLERMPAGGTEFFSPGP
jgi:hypothetical protein